VGVDAGDAVIVGLGSAVAVRVAGLVGLEGITVAVGVAVGGENGRLLQPAANKAATNKSLRMFMLSCTEEMRTVHFTRIRGSGRCGTVS
jgi:hypothetical protein